MQRYLKRRKKEEKKKEKEKEEKEKSKKGAETLKQLKQCLETDAEALKNFFEVSHKKKLNRPKIII